MHADHGQVEPALAQTRILHVLAEAQGPVGEVAASAAQAHAGSGLKVGVAARPSVLEELGFAPATSPRGGTSPAMGYDRERDLAAVSLPVRDHVALGDPGTVLDLHRLYRHVDLVHAHGLHAAALAGTAMTGLPASRRPALVATVGRFRPQSTLDAASAAVVARTAAAVLGTTAPVVDRFVDEVPVAERARLLSPDLSTRLAPAVSRRQVRENLEVPDGAFLVASPLAVADGDALTTFLDAAVSLAEHRQDRHVVFALTGSGRERGLVRSAFVGRCPVVLADEGSAVDVLAAADVVVATADMGPMEPEALMQLARPSIVLGDERTARPWGEAAPRVDADDTHALVQRISAFLDSPAGRVSAGFAARRRVDDVSSAELVAADLLDVYAAALAHRR
ncbi:group 1 glycosyl transferase [Brevibacterium salitolerans]|uniref:Uncharacterized protein n=1 Tax=Brevibacterium salitolerans TaxID=1403566 RepID=A0ABN2X8R2_9MICO